MTKTLENTSGSDRGGTCGQRQSEDKPVRDKDLGRLVAYRVAVTLMKLGLANKGAPLELYLELYRIYREKRNE